MKIYILFTFKNGPYGGVNQFLKALKEYAENKGYYAECPEEADVILFNSGHNIEEVIKYRKLYPNKIFVQRVDGPSRLYNSMKDKRDLLVNALNVSIADATIFQSEFSRNANYKMGFKKGRYETTILNAPNGRIFYPAQRKEKIEGRKCRLIATSFSDNFNKGFEYYEYLDKNLDFDRYEMTFIGNTPIEFANIKHIEPLKSEDLADKLRQADIYITGSKKEACSNALIEAMACGLPAVAIKDGGHPEIVRDAGELFEVKEDIIPCIEKVREHYESYVKQMTLADMEEIGKGYICFFEEVLKRAKEERYCPKKWSVLSLLRVRMAVCILKISEKKNRLLRNI